MELICLNPNRAGNNIISLSKERFSKAAEICRED